MNSKQLSNEIVRNFRAQIAKATADYKAKIKSRERFHDISAIIGTVMACSGILFLRPAPWFYIGLGIQLLGIIMILRALVYYFKIRAYEIGRKYSIENSDLFEHFDNKLRKTQGLLPRSHRNRS